MAAVDNSKPRGLTLIGMPASGKSTVAKIAARMLDWPLVDVDGWLATHTGFPSVGDLIRARGSAEALALEARYIAGFDLHGHVLSPPGSVIYTGVGPQLHAESVVVFLDVPLPVLTQRLARDAQNRRGIIGLEAGGLDELFRERAPLYRALAAHSVRPGRRGPKAVAVEVLKLHARVNGIRNMVG